jgi:hypothetical protein
MVNLDLVWQLVVLETAIPAPGPDGLVLVSFLSTLLQGNLLETARGIPWRTANPGNYAAFQARGGGLLNIFPPLPTPAPGSSLPTQPPPPAAASDDDEDWATLAGASFAPTIARRRPRRPDWEQALHPPVLGISIYADSEAQPFFWKGGS